MASFAAGCTLANPRRRPADAWELLAEFDEVLDRLYGSRTFRPFAMPASGDDREENDNGKRTMVG